MTAQLLTAVGSTHFATWPSRQTTILPYTPLRSKHSNSSTDACTTIHGPELVQSLIKPCSTCCSNFLHNNSIMVRRGMHCQQLQRGTPPPRTPPSVSTPTTTSQQPSLPPSRFFVPPPSPPLTPKAAATQESGPIVTDRMQCLLHLLQLLIIQLLPFPADCAAGLQEQQFNNNNVGYPHQHLQQQDQQQQQQQQEPPLMSLLWSYCKAIQQAHPAVVHLALLMLWKSSITTTTSHKTVGSGEGSSLFTTSPFVRKSWVKLFVKNLLDKTKRSFLPDSSPCGVGPASLLNLYRTSVLPDLKQFVSQS